MTRLPAAAFVTLSASRSFLQVVSPRQTSVRRLQLSSRSAWTCAAECARMTDWISRNFRDSSPHWMKVSKGSGRFVSAAKRGSGHL